MEASRDDCKFSPSCDRALANKTRVKESTNDGIGDGDAAFGTELVILAALQWSDRNEVQPVLGSCLSFDPYVFASEILARVWL